MTHVLGIDPGSRSGFAVLDPHMLLVEYGEVRFDRRRYDCPSVIVKRLVRRYNPTMACVETQYLGANPHSCIALAQNAGRWLEACAAAEIPVVALVAPSTWQSAELGCSSRATTDQRKAISIARCRGLWRVSLSEHCADAALIARWAAVESQQGGSLS